MPCLLAKLKKKSKKQQDLTIKPVAGSWSRRANVERKHYHGDILQPFTGKGHVNPLFVQVYGAGLYGKEFGRKDITEHYIKRGTTRERKATIASMRTGKMKPSQHLGYDVPYKKGDRPQTHNIKK